MNIMFIRLILLSFILTIYIASSTAQENKIQAASLRGKLIGFGNSADLEEFSELQYLVPISLNRVIQIGSDSSFSIELPLTEPTYFRLGRNKLYISPGDQLDVVIDKNDYLNASFIGRGQEVNNYLRATPFPKGGSYVEAGRHIKDTPEATLQFILQTAETRKQQLKKLQNSHKSFAELEYVRIQSDIVRSILSVSSYAKLKLKNSDGQFVKNYLNSFDSLAIPIKDSLVRNLINPNFLKIEVYRDILKEINYADSKNKNWVQIYTDWQKAYQLAVAKIKPQNNKAILIQYREEINTIKTKKYRDILNLLLDDKMKYGNGDSAVDLVLRTKDGNSTKLSSLKGKVIYIDLWATWCGPCMAEMPNFEILKKEYENNKDVAVVSLSIDDSDIIWLNNLEKRKPDGIQWRIDRAMLSAYEVMSIPRYILIDKNFLIADMNAPRASDPKVRALINNLLNK